MKIIWYEGAFYPKLISPKTMSSTARNHQALFVLPTYAASVAILIVGSSNNTASYGSPEFAEGLFPYVLLIAAVCLGLSFTAFAPRQVGLLTPRKGWFGSSWPLLLLATLAAIPWVATALGRPTPDIATSTNLKTGTTMILVGFSEEWIYRGLLIGFFSNKFGIRKGVSFATLLFGAAHLMNILSGVPLGLSLLQVVMTSLVGAVFALGYLSSGSLWPCAVGHFLYDFFLFDTMRLSQGHDASAWSVLPILGAVSLGILSWFRILNGHKVQVEFVRDDDY